MSILARSTRAAVGELAGLHAGEEVEIFFDGPVAVGAVLAGLGEGAAVLADLVGGEVVDVGLAGLDELESPLVELAEVVGGVAEALPVEAEPADVLLDGIDVLLLFLLGIGVVEAQVGLAAELIGQAEIEADGLGVADVEVAVGLGWKAGLDLGVAVLFGAHILGDDDREGNWRQLRSFLSFRICVGHCIAIPYSTNKRFEAGFGLADAGEADLAAEDNHGFKERRRVLASADGDPDGLEHGTRP